MALLILAAVSGTGKSTLARALLDRHPNLRLSVSHTTRSPRPGERPGVHYHFTDRASFEAEVKAGRFVEWAEYAGNLYGTAHSTIEAARLVAQHRLGRHRGRVVGPRRAHATASSALSTASHTTSTSASVMSGSIGSDKTSSAARSATGAGAAPEAASHGWVDIAIG